jgi:hypothetical protein
MSTIAKEQSNTTLLLLRSVLWRLEDWCESVNEQQQQQQQQDHDDDSEPTMVA